MKGYVPWSGTKFYHSIYCSLATNISENFGYPFRLIISFEMVLLTILMFACKANIWSEEENIPQDEWFTEKRCCLPGLVRPMAPHVELLNPVSGLSMYFVELAIIDKLRDGEGWGWQMLTWLLSRRFRKGKKLAETFFGDSVSQLRDLAERQEECERLVRNGGELAMSWYPSAQASKILFERVNTSLSELGKIVGTLIYLCDAIDDFPKDVKRGDFNPFVINRKKASEATMAEIEALQELLQGDSLGFLPSNAVGEVRAILNPWDGRIKYLAYIKGLQLEEDIVPPKPPSWWFDEARSKCRDCKCPCVASVA